jgi:hypothetical protein
VNYSLSASRVRHREGTARIARSTPVPVVPRVMTTGSRTAEFALAPDGTLAYVDAPGGAVPNARTLVWVDRAGGSSRLRRRRARTSIRECRLMAHASQFLAWIKSATFGSGISDG